MKQEAKSEMLVRVIAYNKRRPTTELLKLITLNERFQRNEHNVIRSEDEIERSKIAIEAYKIILHRRGKLGAE